MEAPHTPQQSQGEESRALFQTFTGVAFMRYLSPQTTSSSSQSDKSSTPHFGSVIAPEVTIALLTAQITTLHTQLHDLRQRVIELEEMAYPVTRRYQAPEPENTIYSPIIKLSFRAMKLLFLFLAGFAIAYVLAGSLGATQVTEGLQILMSVWLTPLAGLTFCTIAVAAIVESFK